jgi:hypothetical protein
MEVANILAYYNTATITAEKSFIALAFGGMNAHLSGTPEMFFTRVDSGLTHKD